MSRSKTRVEYRLLLILPLLLILLFLTYGREHLMSAQEEWADSMEFVVKQSAAEEKLLPFYSEKDALYYLFLPSYADLSNVRVYFEGADRIVFEESGETLELKKGSALGGLKTDTIYRASFVQDGETKEETGFKIMHAENLPTLFIRTDSGTMEAVDGDKSVQEAGSYVLMDSDGTLLYADDLDHITGRGNSTWNYPKKSYSIKLENAANLLDMGQAKSWILLSNVEDISYLRNKITYDMAVAAGMDGAPESRYIDLYINNEYNGMYLLCEKIEPGENRVPIADLETENKKLNKNIELAEPAYTERTKGVSLGAVPGDITGGYIVERDEYSKFIEEVSGFQTSLLGELYVIKSPEYASQEEVSYISSLFSDMEKAVVAQDGVNTDTGKDYLSYIYLQSFIQKYMIEEICKNNGGGATSSYFYKPEDAVSTKIFGGPVWDYDKGYGAVDGINDSRRDLCYLTLRDEGTTLFWYLNQHEEFQEEVKASYQNFFSDYITSIMEEKIPAYIEQMRHSADMDVVRWQEIYGEPDSYEQRVSVITDFLTDRKAFLDEVWAQDAPVRTVHFSATDLYIDKYMSVIEGECLTAIPLQEAGTSLRGVIFDGWYTEDGKEFDINEPVYEDVTVYARSHTG
jgi:hypothetical protein